jgi:hypothetical protein
MSALSHKIEPVELRVYPLKSPRLKRRSGADTSNTQRGNKMNTQTIAIATAKCCIWCGYGDHYTDEVFTKDGAQVAHCNSGCEHDATGFTSKDTHDPESNYRHNQGECNSVGCVNY